MPQSTQDAIRNAVERMTIEDAAKNAALPEVLDANTHLARAGITRRIRPYDLRHAFATELIAAGADIGTVAKLIGHSSPAMILNHYQYVMDSQKRAAVESLPIFHVPNACAQTKKAATHKM